MKFNLKNVFLSVGMLAFALVLVGTFSTNKAYANTCLVVGTGAKTWTNASNWSGCGTGFPGALDTVQIPTNVALTMDGVFNATVAAVTFDDPAGTSSSLDLNGNTLTVTGAVTLPASGGVGNATLVVGTGTLNAGSISITGSATGTSSVTVSTGHITTTGNITLAGSATKALLTSTGASEITVEGNFVNTLGTFANLGTATITGNLTGAGGIVTNGANASLNLNGTTNTVATLTATAGGNTVTYGGGAQTVIDTTSHTYYNLILEGSDVKTLTGITTINGMQINGTASATTAANIAIAANLYVSPNATLHLAGYTLGVGTTTDVYGTVDTTSVTGTKTFTGLVTVYSGGVFDLSDFGPDTVFGAGITNNSATLMDIGAGASSLTGNLAGTGDITFGGALTIASGTTLNNNTGTVTVAGALTLTGAWTQKAGSDLALGSTVSAGTFTTTEANTVTYNGGAQTIKVPAAGYYNLVISASGIKDATAADLVVAKTLTINGGTLSLATANTNTANKLYFGTSYQKKGTWGSTGSSPAATHKNNTYFTAAANGLITVTLGNSDSTTTTTSDSSPSGGGTTTTTVSNSTPSTPSNVVSCPTGAVYDTATGKKCTDWTGQSANTVSCPSGYVYDIATGAKCTSWTGGQGQMAGGYAFGTVTVKSGSTGSACKAWQQFFNDKAGAHLGLDGKCGPLTMAVARAWQSAHGLVADGLLGPMSRAKANTQ